MLSVVCWRWKPKPFYRSVFPPETVNVLQRMVKRHYPHPHRFICVTDDPVGIVADVEIVPLWDDYGDLPNPHGADFPRSYRRLRMFSQDIDRVFGPRFVSVDLDCVVVGDLTPLWDRQDDFVAWRDPSPRTPYNGAMMLLRSGSRTAVWTEFDPVSSPRAATRLGYLGSDQAWIGACLGPNEPTWTADDGVLSFRIDVQIRAGGSLPEGAKIVFFHGREDPWDAGVQERFDWVREHWS